MALTLIVSCTPEKVYEKKCMNLTLTAYNSLPYQTRPGTSGNITAWGDTLHPGMKSVAVSRDLLDSGYVYGSMVLISLFPEDTFVVNDKMNRRFTRRMDVYFGKDVKQAREFGKQKAEVCLLTEKKNLQEARLLYAIDSTPKEN
jgi:3D (Asp-Asp-Asp) domain-containing protein